jgi:hypothetical protein
MQVRAIDRHILLLLEPERRLTHRFLHAATAVHSAQFLRGFCVVFAPLLRGSCTTFAWLLIYFDDICCR